MQHTQQNRILAYKGNKDSFCALRNMQIKEHIPQNGMNHSYITNVAAMGG